MTRFRFPAGAEIFSPPPPPSRQALGPTQPPIKLVPGVKRQGREVDHSPLSDAEVKNELSYFSTPLYVFMAWCLVKHKGILPSQYHNNDLKNSFSSWPIWRQTSLESMFLAVNKYSSETNIREQIGCSQTLSPKQSILPYKLLVSPGWHC
jgi:hypothetical protein